MIASHGTGLAEALAECDSEAAAISAGISYFANLGVRAVVLYDFTNEVRIFSNFAPDLAAAYWSNVGIRRDPAVRLSVRTGKPVRIRSIYKRHLDQGGLSQFLKVSESHSIVDALGLFLTAGQTNCNYVALAFGAVLDEIPDLEMFAFQCDIEILVRRVAALRRAAEREELSAREQQTIRLAARGASDKEIARVMRIAPSSVRTLIDRTFEKLGASSRTEAVIMAAKQGLIHAC